jgi:hypothetical protein
MTALVSCHDVRPRTRIFALFEQIGRSLIDQGLELAAFTLSKLTHRCQCFCIHLSRKFFSLHGSSSTFPNAIMKRQVSS